MKEAVKMLVSRRNARAFNIRKPINAIRRTEGLKERNRVAVSLDAETGSTKFNDPFFKIS